MSDTGIKSSERSLYFSRYPFSASLIKGICFLLDSTAILFCGFASYLLIVGFSDSNFGTYLFAILFLWIACFMLFHYGQLYKFAPIMQPWHWFDKLFVAYGIAFMMFLAVAFSLKVSADYSRIWLYTFAASGGVGVVVLRIGLSIAVNKLSALGRFVRNVVIVGNAEQGSRLLKFIEDSDTSFLSLKGAFSAQKNITSDQNSCFPTIGGLDELMAFVRTNGIDDVIVALPSGTEDHISHVVEQLRELPVNIYLSLDLVSFDLSFRPVPNHYDGFPMVEVKDEPISDWSILFKAASDYILAIVALVLLSPLMFLLGVFIKIDSPGPILFRQKRLGFNNVEFDIFKFRSMQHTNGIQTKTIQATRHDKRVTRIGKFIRRTSLDELPQLFNVLNGTMSLVGPRPHAVDHNKIYSRQIRGYFARHRVKPGITGWAQVNGLRGETDVLEKMEARVKHDIYYADNWSLMFDLKIMFMTVFVILFSKDVY